MLFRSHHTKEYMAALLTSVLDSSNKVAEYIAECKNCGIALLPPDVNQSEADFAAMPDGIRFGLAAVKGVGRGFALQVLREREEKGPFTSLSDFCSRMFGQDCNKRVVESLIKCGAFDSLGAKRSQLLKVSEKTMDVIAKTKRDTIEGQYDLFGDADGFTAAPEVPLPDIPEFSRQEMMKMEKETTGLYLTGHPMDDYRELVKRHHAAPMGAILSDFEGEEGPQTYQDGQRVTLAGVVTTTKTKTTKNNTLMAYVGLEDDTGAMELLVFSRALGECAPFLQEGAALLAEGRLSVRDEKAPQLMCDRIRPLGQEGGLTAGLAAGAPSDQAPISGKLYVKTPTAEDPRMRKARLAINMFPGDQQIVFVCADSRKKLGANGQLHPLLLSELRELFGEENTAIR